MNIPGLDTETPDLSRSATRGLALLGSASIASVYYVQPLLVAIGTSFHLSGAMVGLIPTTVQIAVATGIVLLLPLGDIVDNRRLLVTAIAGQVVAMALMAWSPGLVVFLAASALLGLFTIAPYLLPAYAARHTPGDRRGQVTGFMAQGVILGILLARTVSGCIGAHVDWRYVYGFGAIATTALLCLSLRTMPATRPARGLSYSRLLASMPGLLRRERVLQVATLTQALMFGTFNSLWIALSLYVQSPAFGLHSDAVGALGLLGAAAATLAPRAGRLADRFGTRIVARLSIGLTILAWVVMALFGASMWGLCVGIVLLDIGASTTNISKQTQLLKLATDNRTRLVTVYIVGQFLGAGTLALATAAAWAAGGWTWVCALGVATTSLALMVNWLADGRPEPA